MADPQSNLLYRKRHALSHSTAQSLQPLAIRAAPVSGACTVPRNLEPWSHSRASESGIWEGARAHRFNKKPGWVMLQMY